MLFESAEYQRAYQSLDRVRLEGPFSNQALLRAGWAEVSAGNFERALVPWNILAKREVTDAAVQEALLAAPFAYGKLEIHGRAALMYGHALEAYTSELEQRRRLDRQHPQGQVPEGAAARGAPQDTDWVIRLRTLPETPETYYLMALMASHDFQTALSNYLDLEDLRDEAGLVADELRRLRGHDRACASRTMTRCCPRSMRTSASSIRRYACAWSSASTSRSGCRAC